MHKPISKHTFVFNNEDNGGESLSLTTEFFGNGDPGEIYSNQILSLQSYGNSASLNLSSVYLSPELLRKLAKGLEGAEIKAKEMTMRK